MLKYIKQVKYYYFAFIVFELIASFSAAYAIVNMNDMLQNALIGKTTEVYKNIIFIVIFFLISTVVAQFSNNIILKRALRIQNTKLRNQIANKINLLNETEYSAIKKGELISWLTNDVKTVEMDCFEKMFDLTSSILTLSVYALAFYKIGWSIGLVTFIIAIITILIPYLFVGMIEREKNNVSEKQSIFSSKVINLIGGYREFAYKNEKKTYNSFIEKEVCDLERSKFELDKKITYKESVSTLTSLLGQILVIIFSIVFYLLGYVGIGVILATGAMIFTIIQNTSILVSSLTTIKSSKGIIKKYDVAEFTEYKTKMINFESLKIINLNYQIDNKQIFNNFNFKIEKNKKHLLVGPSGSGKSTLFKIIFGLIDNYYGSLTINDCLNYEQLDKRDLWNMIAYVPQENIIFNASLRDNLTLWNENIADQKIVQILEQVNLKYLLEDITLDTMLNNDSKNLSGGEVQRVAIARGLLQDKPFMIMDEITSSLDAKNRESIENFVGQLNKTILYISHTTKTDSKNFDKVIKI